jgi:hypothetical protein
MTTNITKPIQLYYPITIAKVVQLLRIVVQLRPSSDQMTNEIPVIASDLAWLGKKRGVGDLVSDGETP